MKTILISGSCGFIGSHLCEFYLKMGLKVIGVDNLLTGSLINIKNFANHPDFKFIKHDICNDLFIKEKIDYILHFASTASPKDYLKYPIETLRIGSFGTENMLKLAVKNNSTILVASTSEVYGDPLEHPQSESYFGNVNSIGPRGVYDEAKRYLEALTIAYRNNKKLDVRIARIFNTYGPMMRKDDGRVIPTFINQAINNENFTVHGNGLQTRSFSYIDDTILGIHKLLFSNYQLPVNIGNPREYTINEVVGLIKSLIECNSKIKYGKLPENDPKVRRPEIELAKKILMWEPKTEFIEGLKKTIDYFYKIK